MVRSVDLIAIGLIVYAVWWTGASLFRASDVRQLSTIMEAYHYGIPKEDRDAIARAIVAHVQPTYRMLMLSLAYHESSWRRWAVGDGGTSYGLYQLREIALRDVQRFVDPSFPVPEHWHQLLMDDVDYATEGAWKFLSLNLTSRNRANGDLALAVAMHRTGPDVGRASRYIQQANTIIETARVWERRVGWNRLR